jgi:hypothetical protein
MAGLIIALAFPGRRACAALGADAASIVADTDRMNGTCSSKAASKYTIHEIRASSGIAVREFVGGDGKVFAVTWRGPFLPNMRQLLGAYFEPYSQAMRSKHARHRPFVIDQPGLVLHSSGHMRFFSGDAHIPAALPDGVRAEDLAQ